MRAACENFEPLTVRSKEELLYVFGFQAKNCEHEPSAAMAIRRRAGAARPAGMAEAAARTSGDTALIAEEGDIVKRDRGVCSQGKEDFSSE
jgi:hypothetical protein